MNDIEDRYYSMPEIGYQPRHGTSMDRNQTNARP